VVQLKEIAITHILQKLNLNIPNKLAYAAKLHFLIQISRQNKEKFKNTDKLYNILTEPVEGMSETLHWTNPYSLNINPLMSIVGSTPNTVIQIHVY